MTKCNQLTPLPFKGLTRRVFGRELIKYQQNKDS